jgi:hypothetical protein
MSVITYLNQAELDQMNQIAAAAQAGTGHYWQVYEWLADTLQTQGIGSDNPTVLWLKGATEANAGRGAMSELIRAYRSTEYNLRYGGSVSDSLMQQASDAVAKNLIRDINGVLDDDSIYAGIPDIDRIAEADAKAVGNTLFSQNQNDTAFANNSGWSGALLFTQLQSDQTWRLMSPVSTTGVETHDTQINTLNDWRDVLFSYVAYGEGLKAVAVKFANEDMFQQGIDLDILTRTMASYVVDYITSGSNGDLESAIIDGTDNPILKNAFKLIGSIGANVFLDMLMGAVQGQSVIGSTTDANFAANAQAFFGALTPAQLQSIGARQLSDELLEAA